MGSKHLVPHLAHIFLYYHGHGKKHEHEHEQQQGMMRDVPKGCLAVKVGGQGEDQQRFVVPVVYFNHPLFMQLLKEAEEEFGFDQKGTITIPCNIHYFRTVLTIIDQQNTHHHHHHLHLVGCFRVLNPTLPSKK